MLILLADTRVEASVDCCGNHIISKQQKKMYKKERKIINEHDETEK
jgi:hypothetical protein